MLLRDCRSFSVAKSRQRQLAVAPIEANQTKLVLSVTPDGGLLFPPQKGDVWR